MILAQKLPQSIEGQDIKITGVIINLPEQKKYGWRFHFAPTPIKQWPNPSQLRLSWYGKPPQPLRPGQQWQLTVRLKRARGMINPGNFDYSAWLFQHRVLATGYVREKGEQRLLSQASRFNIDNLRYRLAQALEKELGNLPTASMILALALGIKHQMTKIQRNTLQRTGTAHLMAISGLHIGLIAWLTFGLGGRLWCYVGYAINWLPAPRFAALFSLSCAFFYALLAGFSLPTQRALIMVVVAVSTVVLARKMAISHILALTLLTVLLWDPLSVMSVGFWLSFGAVAVIVYALSCRRKLSVSYLNQKGLGAGKAQWAVTLGLFPLLLAISGYISLNSLFANAIAIPWVSLWVVPLTLLGTLLILPVPDLGGELLQSAALTLQWLWQSIQWLDNLEWGVLQWNLPPMWAVLVAIIGVAILLLPRSFPGRWLGVIWLLPLFFVNYPYPNRNEVWLTLLDVGQGLATIVRTQNYALVYDSGPKFSDTFDTGEAIVVPFLRSQGIRQIDKLLISHGDNDHSGGAQSILETLPVKRVLTSATPKINKILTNLSKKLVNTQVLSCQTGQHWHWDGVDFQILHPPPNYFARKRNDHSCVLKVSTPTQVILLPGDIEKMAELRLVQGYSKELKADILIAPHHGSGTSSTKRFINAVQPTITLFSTGYRNRFKHPKKSVVQRYHNHKIKTWNTAETGAISFRLSVHGISVPSLAREQMRRYWHD